MRPQARRPFDGVRVIDLTGGIAGGYAAKLLADAGAEVLAIEPPTGDPLRRRGASLASFDMPSRTALVGFGVHLHFSRVLCEDTFR